jgi:putative transposase
MTSPPALLYDTYYHIYNRGTNRENIFVQERNYEHFMRLYAKYIDPIADTFAYCLLRNHFHLLLKVRSEEEILGDKEDLNVHPLVNQLVKPGVSEKPLASDRHLDPDYASRKFSNFFNAYAKAINAAYGRTGSLFQHPFGRVMVTSDRQFWNVIAYIHQNPQKHRFVKDFRD